jgi:hypothetical protein
VLTQYSVISCSKLSDLTQQYVPNQKVQFFLTALFLLISGFSAYGVLRRIFRPKGDEVTGEWRKLHNEELNNKYSSPNIVRVIKTRRMRLAGHVARR